MQSSNMLMRMDLQMQTTNEPDRQKIAVVGSGPSGLAVADQLNSRGHNVTVLNEVTAWVVCYVMVFQI